MAYIPAGTYTRGNCMGTNNEGSTAAELPLHDIYVSAFYIEKHEVSKTLWDNVANWAITNGYDFSSDAGHGKETDHPATSNTWYDCVKWCNARSEQEGLTPCYYLSPAQSSVYRSGGQDISNSCVNRQANGYRLPTEAEWEKAARGRLAGHRFPWGVSSDMILPIISALTSSRGANHAAMTQTRFSATTLFTALMKNLTQARSAALNQMPMASMIWPATSTNGAGTGTLPFITIQTPQMIPKGLPARYPETRIAYYVAAAGTVLIPVS